MFHNGLAIAVRQPLIYTNSMTWIKIFVCILVAWISLFGFLAQATLCPDMSTTTMYAEARVLVDQDVKESLHSRQMSIATPLTGFHNSVCISLSCVMVALPSRHQTAVMVVSIVRGLPSNLFPDQFLPEVMPPPPRMRCVFAYQVFANWSLCGATLVVNCDRNSVVW